MFNQENLSECSSIIELKRKVWMPPLIKQACFWNDDEYIPRYSPQNNKGSRLPLITPKDTSVLSRQKKKFLESNLIPRDCLVEGKEEFPCLLPYTGSLPLDLVGIDDRVPSDSNLLGVDGFCYDYVLMHKIRNFDRAAKKASRFHCAIGWNFSVFLDAKRCEAVEAIRLNRYSTLALQLRGIPTIQCHAISHCRFYDFIHDGLAPNAPVAIGNRLTIRNPDLLQLQKLGIEELIKRKSPSVLIIVGNRLSFDPGIPVVYYKSRIQKLRDHDYRQNKIS